MNAASPALVSGPARPARRSARSRLAAVVWMALTLGIVAVYARPFALRGWIPHDEGTIAQSAERVLAGEVPHRDFDEGYTGGLSYLHAAAFRAGGVRLATLRWLLYGGFLLFTAAVLVLARGLGRPWLAAALVWTAAAWSVPNYFASLPSWYNLFFATFAALALQRSIEREDHAGRWTFAAGLCAGASVLIKQVGFYAVAAGLLFLIYREQREQRGPRPAAGRAARMSPAFLILKGAGALAFVALLAAVFARRREIMDIVEFVLPGALLAGFLVLDDARSSRGNAVQRLRALGRATGPFLAGVALPLVAFGAAFAAGGAWRPLLRDVFVRSIDPAKHAESTALPPSALWPALPYALLLVFPGIVSVRRQKRLGIVFGLGAILAAALALGGQIDVYRAIWGAARMLPLAVTVASLVFLLRPHDREAGDEADRSRVFLLVSMTAMVGLVQFPFPSPIYFCYVAPLALLAAAALVRADARSPRALHGAILVFFLLFAVLWMNRGYVFRLGRYFSPYEARALLDLPRGGIRVPASEATEYEGLVRAVDARTTPDSLFAGPDCPEVYFLSGRRNPTRSFFDYQGELAERPDELLRRLETQGVAAVVINAKPQFSHPYGPAFEQAIRTRFPDSQTFGRFTLFGRAGAPGSLAYNPTP